MALCSRGAPAAPRDVALLVPASSFFFLFLSCCPACRCSPLGSVPGCWLGAGLGAEPLARWAGLASWKKTLIKAIRSRLMKPLSPAGEHFPLNWTVFATLDFSIALLKGQVDADGVALSLLAGAVTSPPLQELTGA